MNKVLVTGATGFLGYHVVKMLNERSIRPRALVPPGEDLSASGLTHLDVDIVDGEVGDKTVLAEACKGVDTIFHLKFGINLSSGAEIEQQLNEVNVVGTRNVLDAATEANVQRVVVSSSSLAVGLNREPKPLDETADWETYRFDLPYAVSRRQAELEALARSEQNQSPTIVVVSPSFTLGPEDFIGAPANKLVKTLSKGGFRFRIPIGFGCLDVRDYADGALRAAEKGHHGKRYILSGHNVMPDQLIKEVATIAKVEPANFMIPIPAWIVGPIIFLLGLWSKLKNQPPKVSSSILQLWNRHAWYDTSLAQQDLGWKPRPLADSIKDSLDWMQANDTAS